MKIKPGQTSHKTNKLRDELHTASYKGLVYFLSSYTPYSRCQTINLQVTALLSLYRPLQTNRNVQNILPDFSKSHALMLRYSGVPPVRNLLQALRWLSTDGRCLYHCASGML